MHFLLNFEQLQRIFFFQAALLAAVFQAALQAALLKLPSSKLPPFQVSLAQP
jgi:hypothetical protein